jgi:hypothetical protein
MWIFSFDIERSEKCTTSFAFLTIEGTYGNVSHPANNLTTCVRFEVCTALIMKKKSTSGMLRLVTLVETDVSEEHIGHSDDGSDTFLRIVGYYKNHAA